MAIADRINEMYTHVGDVYDTITNVDLPTNKNIQNIPSTMRNSYLEIMNNGIDTIWNNWEKVEGTGETLTLNNTEEAPMKINLKGNTYQDSTTGKNLLGLSNYLYNSNGVNCAVNNGIITLNGTATANAFIRIALDSFVFDANTYTLSANNTNTLSSNDLLRFVNANGVTVGNSLGLNIANASQNMTFNTTTDTLNLQIRIENGTTLSNFVIKPMLEVGSSATSYEPYTGNQPSPNPDYPQDIQVVSGDNTIKVEGKNLFDNSVERKNAFTTGNVGQQVGYGSSSVSYSYVNCAYLQANTTYTISWNKNTPVNTNARDSVIVDENNIILEKPQIWTNNRETYTFTPTHNGYLIFVYDINTTNIQLEKGNQASSFIPYQTPQTYPINLGDIELCKIGDYQDSIVKDNGKWYLNKQIGKVVLNGSESGWSYPSANRFNLDGFANNYLKSQDNITYMSNNYIAYKQTGDNSTFNTLTTNTNYGFNLSSTISNFYTIRFKDTRYTSIADFQSWLSTHNTTIYYVLAIPTYTEITDTTLISQLETVKRSYNEQTNITQTNDDKPFILDVTALKELTQ